MDANLAVTVTVHRIISGIICLGIIAHVIAFGWYEYGRRKNGIALPSAILICSLLMVAGSFLIFAVTPLLYVVILKDENEYETYGVSLIVAKVFSVVNVSLVAVQLMGCSLLTYLCSRVIIPARGPFFKNVVFVFVRVIVLACLLWIISIAYPFFEDPNRLVGNTAGALVVLYDIFYVINFIQISRSSSSSDEMKIVARFGIRSVAAKMLGVGISVVRVLFNNHPLAVTLDVLLELSMWIVLWQFYSMKYNLDQRRASKDPSSLKKQTKNETLQFIGTMVKNTTSLDWRPEDT